MAENHVIWFIQWNHISNFHLIRENPVGKRQIADMCKWLGHILTTQFQRHRVNIVISRCSIFQRKWQFTYFIFRYIWNKYCFWNTASQIIQWASVGIWNCTGKCWTNVDKEVIKFIGYVIPIRIFISILFELGLVDWHLITIYDRFDDIPILFHITFVSGEQFLIKKNFSHFNQILQFALVSFISVFIKGSFDLCIHLIQFVFISDWIFQGLRQPWFSIVVFLFFTLVLGKHLLYKAIKWLWNWSKGYWVSQVL